MVLVLLLALVAQGDIRRLVEKLGSDSVEEREEAMSRLALAGKEALPELEKAAKSADLDLATRARYLVRYIPIREQVTPNLLHLLPGAEERLSIDDPASWTRILLEALKFDMSHREQGKKSPLLPEDVRGVVPLALKGAADAQEREWVCSAIVHLKLRTAAPDVATLLDDPTASVRRCARETLRRLQSPLAAPGFRRALREPDPQDQVGACEALAALMDVQAAPEIASLLASESPYVRGQAVRALGWLRASGEVRRVRDLLADPSSSVRFYAVQAANDLADREAAPKVRSLLRDPDPDVRAAAARAVAALEGKAGIPALREMMTDRVPLVWGTATELLCRFGVREAAPRLLQYPNARLESLNGVRRPEAWSRLESVRIRGPLEGTVADLRARMVKEAGLPIEWPDLAPAERRELAGDRETIVLVDYLRYLVDGWPEIVLESDRIRLLPPEEAERFWREWWAAEEKKK